MTSDLKIFHLIMSKKGKWSLICALHQISIILFKFEVLPILFVFKLIETIYYRYNLYVHNFILQMSPIFKSKTNGCSTYPVTDSDIHKL